MKRLVFGIVGVACLQAAYMTYSAGERYFAAAVYPVAPTVSAPQEIAHLSEQVESFTSGENNYRPVMARFRPVTRARASATFKPRQRHPATSPQLIARAEAHKPPSKQIRPDTVRVEVDSFDTTYADLERRYKKSFFAKALPIVKKPYDWLKAIGSKLR